MVWMRPSVHSDVRKLYGVINTDIPAGEGFYKARVHAVSVVWRLEARRRVQPVGACRRWGRRVVAGVAVVQLTAGLGAQAGVAMEHSTTTC